MKIRRGFVSNSSTSSFIGVMMNAEGLTNKLRNQLVNEGLLLQEVEGTRECIGRIVQDVYDNNIYLETNVEEFIALINDTKNEIESFVSKLNIKKNPIITIQGCVYDSGFRMVEEDFEEE